jgi:hypothetical protein
MGIQEKCFVVTCGCQIQGGLNNAGIRHSTGRIGWLRAAVLGANDDILSSSSLVLGVAGAHATDSNVGRRRRRAGAMSMAAGEYVSAHSQADIEQANYGHANAEERFLLDFFIGRMVRDHEGYGSRYSDLTSVTLTIRGKQQKTRTVEISPRLAGEINNRRKRSNSEYPFPNRKGKPNQHLLRDLWDLAKKSGAKFHTELHKLRKPGSQSALPQSVGLPTFMQELGHESIATTQRTPYKRFTR